MTARRGMPLYAVFPRVHLRVSLLAIPAAALCIWLEGLLPAALLFAAALLHEGGHFVALLYWHVPIRRVDIRPMGALIVYDDSACSLPASAWIAFWGAGCNLLAFLLTFPLAVWLGSERCLPLLFFSLANAFLAFLNLLPWRQLDGGRLLLALLLQRLPTDRSEAICRDASVLAYALLCALLLWLGIRSSFPLWSMLLAALLLAQTARS